MIGTKTSWKNHQCTNFKNIIVNTCYLYWSYCHQSPKSNQGHMCCLEFTISLRVRFFLVINTFWLRKYVLYRVTKVDWEWLDSKYPSTPLFGFVLAQSVTQPTNWPNGSTKSTPLFFIYSSMLVCYTYANNVPSTNWRYFEPLILISIIILLFRFFCLFKYIILPCTSLWIMKPTR